MLKAKGLPGMFWGEAVATAVYVLNRSTSKGCWWEDALRAVDREHAGRAAPAHDRVCGSCQGHEATPTQARRLKQAHDIRGI
jgi:hypothetical protein